MHTPLPFATLASRALRALGLLAMLLPAPAAFASNLLANPGFDGGSAGWTLWSEPGRFSSQWRSEDATGDAGSGSLRVQNLGDLATAYTGATQCLSVAAGGSYLVQGRLRIPVG